MKFNLAYVSRSITRDVDVWLYRLIEILKFSQILFKILSYCRNWQIQYQRFYICIFVTIWPWCIGQGQTFTSPQYAHFEELSNATNRTSIVHPIAEKLRFLLKPVLRVGCSVGRSRAYCLSEKKHRFQRLNTSFKIACIIHCVRMKSIFQIYRRTDSYCGRTPSADSKTGMHVWYPWLTRPPPWCA